MAHRIRSTQFTWDPDTETRATVWRRIKVHIEQELNRIHAASVLQRRLARRQAGPHYARNHRLVQAARRGVSDTGLARQFGLTPRMVRDIIRLEARWYTRHDPHYATLRDEHPVRHDSTYDLEEMPAAIPRTMTLMTDP